MDDALPDSAPLEERFAIGGWFEAECPSCSSDAGSFFCEVCGHHFEPDETPRNSSRRGRIIEWKPNVSAFLELPTTQPLIDLWSSMSIEKYFAEIGERYIAQTGPRMRLTVPEFTDFLG